MGEVVAIPGEDGVIPLGQVLDKGVGVGQFGRGDHLFVGGIQLAVADVVGDGSGEQVGILQDDPQGAAQGVLFNQPDIDSVVGDGARLDFIKPVDQVGDGGFARTGGTHKGDFLAGFGKQADVVEDGLILVVAKHHVVEPHIPQNRLQHHSTGGA